MALCKAFGCLQAPELKLNGGAPIHYLLKSNIVQNIQIETMLAQRQKLYQHVEFLTSVTPARNYANLNSLEKVGQYLKRQFREMGGVPEEQTWSAAGNEYKNIITSYNFNKNRRLIVGAHYDVAGDQPGADDNASAVAGLLETAHLVFANKPDVDYRIDFVAFCLEEPPFFAGQEMGSYVHAKSLYEDNVEVIGMINYEMIGYFSDEPQYYPVPELAEKYPELANFIMVVGREEHQMFNNKVHQLMTQNSKIDVQVISVPPYSLLSGYADLSDHMNYWKFGYPALMINDTSMLRNHNYHQVTDTIDTLDFEKMAEVINCAYNAIIGL